MSAIDLFAALDNRSFSMSTTLALALVALIGYVFGQRTRGASTDVDADQARQKLRRAERIAKELETIADTVRKSLAKHHTSVAHFRERVTGLGDEKSDEAWTDLCKEAESMLKPTLRLATDLSDAYEKIRRQSTQLMTFTEMRIDPLTGLNNRQVLDDAFEYMFAMLSRYDRGFSLAVFDIDHFKQIDEDQGRTYSNQLLEDVSRLLDEISRDTDIVGRFGGEEFVVILPQARLDGACTFGERCRQRIESELPITISGGVATAVAGDTSQTLLARADSALYGAKAAGRNLLFRHNGVEIELAPTAPNLTAPNLTAPAPKAPAPTDALLAPQP